VTAAELAIWPVYWQWRGEQEKAMIDEAKGS